MAFLDVLAFVAFVLCAAWVIVHAIKFLFARRVGRGIFLLLVGVGLFAIAMAILREDDRQTRMAQQQEAEWAKRDSSFNEMDLAFLERYRNATDDSQRLSIDLARMRARLAYDEYRRADSPNDEMASRKFKLEIETILADMERSLGRRVEPQR